jgi:HK97 family phage major capsid protein
MSLNQLRDKRGQIVADARAILNKVEGEKRAMTTEEEKHYDSLIDEQNKLKNTIEREVQLKELEREAVKADVHLSKAKPSEDNVSPEMAFYRDFLLNRVPQNALQTDSNTGGGYLTPPQQVVEELLKKMDDIAVIRQFATIFQVPNADSLGCPSLENDPDDFDWTTELQSGTDDTGMNFGKRELRPHPVAKRIKVSKTLLRRVPNTESIVNERMAYKLGVTQEKAYLLGNGNQRPLGLFVASNNGIPTSRDFSTGNTTTSIGMDGVLEAFYGVKTQYQRNGQWLLHRDAVKQVSKLKDTTNQYLWQPGIKDGDPDTLKGRPVSQSEYVPNTFTTGQYVGLFGDLSYYYIADGMSPQLQRLQELYAENNQDGFIMRYEGDGMPVLGEAFSRMKLA